MLGNGRVSIWDQACPAHRYAKPFQRQEMHTGRCWEKFLSWHHIPRTGGGCGSSMAKRQAGVGFCLKQSSGEVWLKSAEIMEALRDTSLHAAESKQHSQNVLGPNHNLAMPVPYRKIFTPTTTSTIFSCPLNLSMLPLRAKPPQQFAALHTKQVG